MKNESLPFQPIGAAGAMVEKIPLLRKYILSRGWPFILSWLHRLTGIFLVFYLLLHIYTLSFLKDPSLYSDKMELFRSSVFIFLEWALGIPVIFHALNGNRLILYEIFRVRYDILMIRWVFGVSILFASLTGILFFIKNQTVSATFFWLIVFFIGILFSYAVFLKMKKTKHSLFWKFQRITAAFLLIMIPAHFIFMHLNPSIGKDAVNVISRIRLPFIKFIDVLLTITIIFHAIYGVISIGNDYIANKRLRWIFDFCIIGLIGIFALIGIKIIFEI